MQRIDSTLLHSKEHGDFNAWLEILRRKWSQVPAGLLTRAHSSELLGLPDQDLVAAFESARNQSTQGGGFSTRGWYHTLYKDILREKRVLDVGSGLGIDGITFAEHGAQMTFLDIVESNLQVIEKLCRLRGIRNVEFCYLEKFDSLSKLRTDFDVMWCQGSLINAPFHITRIEVQELLRHLKLDGRWIELAYPQARWEREGKLPFEQWGDRTDGGAPWIEWYDLTKVQALLAPARFDVVLHFEFHDQEFNWFDLIRRA